MIICKYTCEIMRESEVCVVTPLKIASAGFHGFHECALQECTNNIAQILLSLYTGLHLEILSRGDNNGDRRIKGGNNKSSN